MPVLSNSTVSAGTCDCACKRKTTKLFNYGIEELNAGYIYTDKGCVCNEIIALEQRHQVDDGARYTSILDLKKYLRPFIKTLSPTSEDHIISRCGGNKRALMLQAKFSLEERPLKASDNSIKMFLKDDKYPMTKEVADFLGQVDKNEYGVPRCIQYRNKRYCLRLATYLHPIEQHVYGLVDQTGTPIFAKSRNLTQRGQDLDAKWSYFSRPIALLMDHSKFDAHISVNLLKLEHWFYMKCSGSSELLALLHAQLEAHGATKNGTHYKTKGTRMSGDQNTGLGNSIINYAMLAAYAEHHGLSVAFYVDGDDSVMICEDDDKRRTTEFFAQFGMKTKLDFATEFSKVDFCQTRPVFDGVTWRMVRNPYRTITRMPWTTKEISSKNVNTYLASIGDCEVALGLGLPIGQFIGDKLRGLTTKRTLVDLHYVANREFVRPHRARVVAPTQECRLSYFDAWDISPEQQVVLETQELLFDFELDESTFEERPFTP